MGAEAERGSTHDHRGQGLSGRMLDNPQPGYVESFDDYVQDFKQFYDELFEQYRLVFSGPGHLLNRMKGFWTYFSKAFHNSRNIAKKVHRTQKIDRYMKIVDRFFAEEAQWREWV